ARAAEGGRFVQQIQSPESGKSAYFRNRQILLAMTASAALLAGLASAEALPLDQQALMPQWQGLRPAAKPHGVAVASREKQPAKTKPAAEEIAGHAKGVLTGAISDDRQTATRY